MFVKPRCVARRKRINKEIDAQIKRESMLDSITPW